MIVRDPSLHSRLLPLLRVSDDGEGVRLSRSDRPAPPGAVLYPAFESSAERPVRVEIAVFDEADAALAAKISGRCPPDARLAVSDEDGAMIALAWRSPWEETSLALLRADAPDSKDWLVALFAAEGDFTPSIAV